MMMTPRIALRAALLAALLLLSSGCKEKEVPFVVDEDEIGRYINDIPEAKELFGSDSLVSVVPYTLPFNGYTYHDSVLSHQRAIDMVVRDTTVDYGSLGELREALVRVTDTVHVMTTRYKGADTTKVERKRLFVRHGFFLKLGDDAQPYVGWVLFGFSAYNGTDNSYSNYVKLWRSDGFFFPGDSSLYNRRMVSIVGPPYIRLTDIVPIDNGSKLRIEIKSNRHPMLSFYSDSIYTNLPMTKRSTNIYMDTIKTPSNNTVLYNLITLQALNDTTGVPVRAGSFIPYRVIQ